MLFARTSLLALATSLSNISSAKAYWLVATDITSFIPGPVGGDGYQWIHVDNLECNTMIDAPLVNDRSDVSGDKQGVRMESEEGDCDHGGNWWATECPTEVEQHFPEFHQTWYADRDNTMVNLEGGVVGSCRVDMTHDIQCEVTAGMARFQTLLECTQTA
ncbi:hypothetical protein DPSP01_008092 [Paraphaeosphaeria sporulosa]|uniref:Ecp2 effector protein domain-containing protein n=1 Tax=Paraphaeosphaeria sporulosa TaxID=1460663 RepID=A0A177CNZ1_9PLEO|nr:uncharacterized protein CC84DRAFT_1174319 [Paraphaeosphaeria sporulosa]OAG08921.1 hypothetical protein CC84DRAFT_1174319 [Paraphaeosphaeria sporulosa]